MQRFARSILVLLTICQVGYVIAADTITADPKAAISKVAMCIGCHGIDGYQITFPKTYRIPKIGGQKEDYLVNALKGYKSGERLNQTMQAIAKSLSDQDIANLAAYYSQGGAAKFGGRLK